MRIFISVCLTGLVALAGGCERGDGSSTTAALAPGDADSVEPEADADTASPTDGDADAANDSVLAGITMTGLDGEPVDLADFDGKAVLLVNVASRCGHTPQYAGLQNLHERYADAGLVVVGVPSNDFGGQEPGTADEIASFCQTNYGVSFTMLDKVHVKGDDKTELYQRLTDPAHDPTDGGEVQWNFEKFLVNRDGAVTARFRSDVQPESDEVVAAIEQALN